MQNKQSIVGAIAAPPLQAEAAPGEVGKEQLQSNIRALLTVVGTAVAVKPSLAAALLDPEFARAIGILLPIGARVWSFIQSWYASKGKAKLVALALTLSPKRADNTAVTPADVKLILAAREAKEAAAGVVPAVETLHRIEELERMVRAQQAQLQGRPLPMPPGS